MMMIVDMSNATDSMEIVADGLAEVGKELGVVATMQHEDIFNCMHRI